MTSDVHQDVHDAFNRFVDASVAYFQFSDRSLQLQQEYNGIPESSSLECPEGENRAQSFDVNEFQMQQLMQVSKINQKKCVLDAFVAKGKNAKGGKHHVHAKKLHNPTPSKSPIVPDNDDGLL